MQQKFILSDILYITIFNLFFYAFVDGILMATFFVFTRNLFMNYIYIFFFCILSGAYVEVILWNKDSCGIIEL